MNCLLTRWMISRFEDTGKAMPPWAARHLERCAACRSFSSFSRALPSRLFGEVPASLTAAPDVHPERNPRLSETSPSSGPARFRSFFRPVPAAALVLLLVAGAFLFQGVWRGSAISAEKARAALADLKRVTAVPDDWPGIVTAAESPLERERLILENAARSAYAYLQDRLNITIERKSGRAT